MEPIRPATFVAIMAFAMIIMHMATMVTLLYRDAFSQFLNGITTEEIYAELERRAAARRHNMHRRRRIQSDAFDGAELTPPVPSVPSVPPMALKGPSPVFDELSIAATPVDAYQQPVDAIAGAPFESGEGYGFPVPAYGSSSSRPSVCKNFNTFNF